MSIICMLISMWLGLNSFYFSLDDWKDYFFIRIRSRQTHKNIKGYSRVPRGRKKKKWKKAVFWSDLPKAVSEFLWISVYIFRMCKLCLLFFKVLLFQMLVSAKKLNLSTKLTVQLNFSRPAPISRKIRSFLIQLCFVGLLFCVKMATLVLRSAFKEAAAY